MKLLALLVLLAPAAAAQSAVHFRGAPGATGDVVQVDLATGAASIPAGLGGVRLLGVDFNGRTELERLRLDRPRLVEDVPGAARIALPQARGSLYRFSRDEAAATMHGYFLVDPAGAARVVLERPGTGPLLATDPFLPRVAIDSAGTGLLAGTTLAAGGDLLEVDLVAGTVVARSAQLPPLYLAPGSLALGGTWGVAATRRGLWRFDRGHAGDAEEVSFPGGAPPWQGAEVVLSPSGVFAATIAGDGPASALPFVFTRSGAARAASRQPQHLSGAGFLPDAPHGPYLAVSDDGARCAWRVETALTREAFLARVEPAPDPVHVTSDTYFVDTIDEIGQFLFRPGQASLRAAIGKRSPTPPYNIEKLDLFRLDLAAGGAVQIANLSMTSGVATPPFQPSLLDPENGLFWLPEAQAWLLHDSQSGGGGELVRVDAAGGLQVLFADAKALERIERAGPRLALAMRRASGNKDREVRTLDPQALALSPPLLTVPDTDTFDAIVPHPGGSFLVVHRDPQHERLWRWASGAGAPALMTTRPLLYADPIGWTSAGGCLLSAGDPAIASIQVHWPPASGPLRLPVPPAAGFVLPGL